MKSDTYFGNIKSAIQSSWAGAALTLKHLAKAVTKPARKPVYVSDPEYFKHSEGIETLQFPKEKLPVPDNGRYQLHNEIDDCIVCDKCAKACPVNCIEIEPIKSLETIGFTSDGTPKRIHAAQFDIDMGKCCFCGLCTTVCPTECLTMLPTYDYSVQDVSHLIYQFSEMTEAEAAEKKQEYEAAQAEKAKAKLAAQEAKKATTELEKPVAKKTTFKPKVRPTIKPKTTTSPLSESPSVLGSENKSEEVKSDKPAFRPKIRPKVANKPAAPEQAEEISSTTDTSEKAVSTTSESSQAGPKKPKPAYRPKVRMKPKIKPPSDEKEDV